MKWSRLSLSDLAIASLVAIGLFLIAISVPPLYNPIFAEEPEVWSPLMAANGALYVATAVLVAYRTRVGVGLAMVLGMLGFTMALGLTLSWLGYGFSNIRTTVETFVTGLVAGAHAVVVVGVLDGARRWKLVAEIETPRRVAAALFAGLGFALTLGTWLGDFAVLLTPIEMPESYQAVQYWVAIPQFVAFAAITLNARFATLGSLVVAAASFLLAVQVVAALFGFRGGIDLLTDSIALWTMMAGAWGAAAMMLLVPIWIGTQAPTERLAPDQK
jgi:hypothetical protein